MNYISAEEFLKQSDNVQKVLWDWWKPETGDLFFATEYYDIGDGSRHMYGVDKLVFVKEGDLKKYGIDTIKDVSSFPAFQMHQLIQFIEDKTNLYIEITHYSKHGYSIVLNNLEWCESQFNNLGDDLLQALWQVAIKVSEQEG